MDCYNCPIEDICVISQTIREFAYDAHIEVTECKHKANVLNQPLTQGKKHEVKQYTDFSQASKAAEAKQKGLDDKVSKIKVLPMQKLSDKEPCPGCGILTTTDDIKQCDGKDCTNVICGDCGTEVEGKRYCPTCWSKMT